MSKIKKKDILITKSIPGFVLGSFEHMIYMSQKPFYIQTPISRIISNKRNWIVLSYSQLESSHKLFFKQLDDIQEHIKKKLPYENWQDIYISQEDNIKNIVFNKDDPVIFDQSGTKLEEDISDGDCVDVILHIEKVKVANTYMNMNIEDIRNFSAKIVINVVQFRVHNKTIDKTVSNFESVNIEMNKYKKMLKHGVPETAVIQKILMENKDPKDFGFCTTETIIPKKNPINFLKDLGTVKLKHNSSKIVAKSKSKTLNISLEDILLQISKLRKT